MTLLQFHRQERGWLGPKVGAGVRRVRRLISKTFRKSPPSKRLASQEDLERLRQKYAAKKVWKTS